MALRTSGCSASARSTHSSTTGGCTGGSTTGTARPLGAHAGAADQLVERDALGAQVVVGGDLLRGGEVEARLRLARVGDGRGADLEIALGRGELLGDGGLAGARGGQRVLCASTSK